MCLLKQKKWGQCQGRSTSALETPPFSLSLFLSVFLCEALKKIDPKFCTDPFQTFPDFGASIPLSRFHLFLFSYTVRQLYYFELPPRPSLVPWQEIFLDWLGSKLYAIVRAPSFFGKSECLPSFFFFFVCLMWCQRSSFLYERTRKQTNKWSRKWNADKNKLPHIRA